MVNYKKHVLKNGLTLLVHEDENSPLVAMNILYKVGAKDENSEKTGFAHLFEHLMFGGSANIEDYDEPLENVGGDNNAFTNNDYTNYYLSMPYTNIETAFWLESDRMKQLAFSRKSLKVQRQVVLEEFRETCLNKPYGDVWHHLRALAYQKHPYRWPTIGLEQKHIVDAKMSDVKHFYEKFYNPNNAILGLAGKITMDEAISLTEKWFADIEGATLKKLEKIVEPKQSLQRRKVVISEAIPVDKIYIAFHCCHRTAPEYYATDILSDVLCTGKSSRLYRELVKEKKLFSTIDAYITGDVDPGLLIVEGRLQEGIEPETAEKAVFDLIKEMENKKITKEEIQKVLNKIESSLLFSETNSVDIAMNLCYYEMLEDLDLINEEINRYKKVRIEDVQNIANEILIKENSNVLYYIKKK